MQIILLGAAAAVRLRGRVLHALLAANPAPVMLESLGDYPRWLIVACVTIVLAAVIWIGLKLLKIALWVMLVSVLVVGLLTAAWLLWQ